MLYNLHIENVAVIEKTDIEFSRGFNVLTGETGAGKSIIIDSVNMILGARASKELIRAGESKAHVSAVFNDIPQNVRDVLLNDFAIELEDDMLIISRDIICEDEESKVRNVCRVNSRIVTVSSLREIGKYLVNIHGQNDNQFLLDQDKHIDFLDEYAMTKPLLLEYKVIYNKLVDINKNIKALQMDEDEKQNKLETLEYQIKEIENAQLVCGEDTELEEKRKIMQNVQNVSSAIASAYANIYGAEETEGYGAYDLISQSASMLASIADLSDSFRELSEKCMSVLYAAEDLSETLRDLKGEYEYDDDEMNYIENRLDLIHRLKNKYVSGSGSISDISDYYQKIMTDYNNIKLSDEQIENLNTEKKQLLAELTEKADELSKGRHEAAIRLEQNIISELKFLEMDKVEFSVDIIDTGNKFYACGRDEVRFLISTNPGEDLKPLAKIASGGELSRVMLALKKVLSSADDVKTLIFDEIDTGVSGRAAGKIGLKLREVAVSSQVLCITHLAQIASLAGNHLLIKKDTSGTRTFTSVMKITGDERIDEIARILAGVTVTKNAKITAKEMLEQGNNL